MVEAVAALRPFISLVFTAFLIVQGHGAKFYCDVQGVSACYWAVGVWYGRMPLADNVPENRNEYLARFCQLHGSHEEFPVNSTCKALYGSCSEAEKRMFSRMEAGYSVLRDATRATKACESVVLLRQCLDLEEIRRCDVIPHIKEENFQAQAEAYERGARNLKTCLLKAVEPCKGHQRTAAIALLEKVADAIVDLSSQWDGRSVTSTTRASITIIGGALLYLLVIRIVS